MPANKLIWYNPNLKPLARNLRSNSTKSEIRLWMNIKGRVLGYQFHRQVPIDNYIVDFYCHELKLAIEIDGYTHDYNYDKDMRRQERLESFGIRVVRFTHEDVLKHLNDVLRSLQAAIIEIQDE